MALDDFLPLPFRVLFLLALGSWLWLLTLRVAQEKSINLHQLLRLDTRSNLYAEHEAKCTNISIVAILAFLGYTLLHDKSQESLSVWDLVPLVVIVWSLYHICSPRNSRMHSSVSRVLRGGINRDIRTNDIVLSDTLTSYSRVLVDMAIYICHLYNFQTCLPKDSGSKLDRSCGEHFLLDTLIGSIPNFIRLSQCVREYKLTGDKMHMYNFLKYSSNIPVLITGLLMRQREGYLTTWIFFALFNSCYSFWWDISNDWNLNLFRSNRGASYLRNKLHYEIKHFYHFAIAFDMFGRFIWLTKFLPVHQESWYFALTCLYTTENGWFALEILEILRRWVWVFIKLEVDFISMTSNKDIEMLPQ